MMKHTLSCLLFCFILNSYKAQQYTPFPENTAVWDINVEPNGPNNNIWVYKRYVMDGDTIINNLSYNKIYCFDYTIQNNILSMKKLGYCFSIRQDINAKKIYRTLLVNNTVMDTLLYNYDLKIGDTVPTTYVSPKRLQTVTGIDSVLLSGKKYRRFKLHTSGMMNASLIEGVGNANGLIEEHIGFFEGGYKLTGFCNFTYTDCKDLLALGIDERTDAEINIFPNPFTDELTIQFKEESKNRTLVITDILGKQVQAIPVTGKQAIIYRGDLKSGVYFLRVSEDRTGSYTKKIILN